MKLYVDTSRKQVTVSRDRVEKNDQNGRQRVERGRAGRVVAAGLTGKQWAPRELRQSFVSLLSDARVPVEVISRLAGHRSTTVTETVYRKQLRPVIEGGPDVMDRIFPGETKPGP